MVFKIFLFYLIILYVVAVFLEVARACYVVDKGIVHPKMEILHLLI